MDNQQLYGLTNNEIQLLLSLYFGDGSYVKQSINGHYGVNTSCIYEDYLVYKKSILTNLTSSTIKLFDNFGYKKDGKIYKFSLHEDARISTIFKLSFIEKLNLLDELGLALWFYDDGSLHKTALFYNLCTHAFTVEQQELIVEKLKTYNLQGKIIPEVKKDGRKFYYICIRKYEGANTVSNILSNINIESFKYKLWSSETIQKWSTLQEEWKSLESAKSYNSFKEFAISKYRSEALKKAYDAKKIKI